MLIKVVLHVRSRSASGTAILNATNQLSGLAGVKPAMPNFIQFLSDGQREQMASSATRSET